VAVYLLVINTGLMLGKKEATTKSPKQDKTTMQVFMKVFQNLNQIRDQ